MSHNVIHGTDRDKRIQCLDRAMDVMEHLSRLGSAGVSEIARELGLHVATTHNILKTLASRAYVVNVAGRYSVGPALAALGGTWSAAATLPALAKPLAEAATERTGEAVVLAVPMGTKVLLHPLSPGTNPVTVQVSTCVYEDPLGLATGSVLAAEGAVDLRTPSAEVVEWLETVRREGCCILRREEGGVDSVAVPVRGPGGEVLAAIGSHMPTFRGTQQHMTDVLHALLEAAASLSGTLGHEGGPAAPSIGADVVSRHFDST